MNNLTFWALLLVAGVINSSGSLLLKQSSIAVKNGAFAINYWFLTGLVCYGMTFVLFSFSLSKINISVAYPILSGASFMLVTLGSVLFFQEFISLRQYAGIFLIFLGILAVSL